MGRNPHSFVEWVEALSADTHLLFDSQAHECHEFVGAQLIAPVRMAADRSTVDSNLGAMNRAPTRETEDKSSKSLR
jgi:hypothetical protein